MTAIVSTPVQEARKQEEINSFVHCYWGMAEWQELLDIWDSWLLAAGRTD